jgi:hypothetical protein
MNYKLFTWIFGVFSLLLAVALITLTVCHSNCRDGFEYSNMEHSGLRGQQIDSAIPPAGTPTDTPITPITPLDITAPSTGDNISE